MKKLIFTLLIGQLWSLLSAQELKIDSVTNNIYYEEIVTVDSLSAIDILKTAKKWAISVFGAGKEMIDYYDEGDLLMIIKPVNNVHTSASYYFGPVKINAFFDYVFYHKLEIETKNNKYKIRADQFLVTFRTTTGSIADQPRTDKMPAQSLLFFDQNRVEEIAVAMYKNNPKRREEYIEVMRKEKSDLQESFDRQIKIEFDGLKSYIKKRPRKDW